MRDRTGQHLAVFRVYPYCGCALHAVRKGCVFYMLQPLPLKDVSVRYTKEITELRDFLVKADCAVGTTETLGGIVVRLPRDPAFRRDLISHVWEVIDRYNRQISYSDLLGMVAIAAAGKSFAAAANEDDAHNLLRFLMEARRSLDIVPDDRVPDDRGAASIRWTAEPAADLSTGPFQSAANDGQVAFGKPVQLLQKDLNFLKVPKEIGGSRRRIQWVIAAVCVIAALLIGLRLKPRPAADVGNTSASVTPAAAGGVLSASVPEKRVSPSTVGPSKAVATGDLHSPSAPKNSRVTPLSPTTQASHQTPTAASSVPPRSAEIPPQAIAAATHDPVFAPTMKAPAADATSSVRLGTASTPLDPSEQGRDSPAARTSKPPILLHRRPPASSSAVSEDGAANLVSEVRSPDVPTTLGNSRTPSADAAREGTVRLTSLGTMAANIMYSPLPAYPAAASASHVQGEVKVRAEVDRNGSVASVRVISGPPLLRDAALDAVQRWRYRPYMSLGEPIPMAAVAIMEFQLP
ncbi:MAG: TonB family protein [Acidobacteriaceae bacterium]|nr:TonB family protein [Acidobacteriaceae bacterium]